MLDIDFKVEAGNIPYLLLMDKLEQEQERENKKQFDFVADKTAIDDDFDFKSV